MPDSFETTIKNFSGLSSEVKPTIAAGNTVPNGSRWREVDTDVTWFFNLIDDAWYKFSGGAGDSVFEGSDKKQLVQDNNAESILSSVLKELKIMNIHLSIINDTHIKNTEVE